MNLNRRGFLGALLSLPFAKPALKAIMVPVTAVSSRYARFRALRTKKERALWIAMLENFEAQLWATPEE